jgi:hypothetical protein
MFYPSAGEEQPDRWDKTRAEQVSNNTTGCTVDLTSRLVEKDIGGLGNRCILQRVNRSGVSEALYSWNLKKTL